MTTTRCLSLVLCASVAVVVFGCDHHRDSEPPPGLSPPAPAVSESPSAAAIESPSITVTPEAAAAFRKVTAGLPGAGEPNFRLRVVPGGCQGYLYRLGVEYNVSSEDQVCESRGVNLVIFKRQAEMLRGTRIDFVEENGEQGFKLDSPNFKGESAEKWLAALAGEKDVE